MLEAYENTHGVSKLVINGYFLWNLVVFFFFFYETAVMRMRWKRDCRGRWNENLISRIMRKLHIVF